MKEKSVLEPPPRSNPKGHNVFASRFVDHIKNAEMEQAYEKYRLKVQEFNDRSYGILTHVPPVQRYLQRISLPFKLLFLQRKKFSTCNMNTLYIFIEIGGTIPNKFLGSI